MTILTSWAKVVRIPRHSTETRLRQKQKSDYCRVETRIQWMNQSMVEMTPPFLYALVRKAASAMQLRISAVLTDTFNENRGRGRTEIIPLLIGLKYNFSAMR